MIDIERLNYEIAGLREQKAILREHLSDGNGLSLNADQTQDLILAISDLVDWLEQLFVEVRELYSKELKHDH